jgi:hypothetical protein
LAAALVDVWDRLALPLKGQMQDDKFDPQSRVKDGIQGRGISNERTIAIYDVVELTNSIVWDIRHLGYRSAGYCFRGGTRRRRSPADGRED